MAPHIFKESKVKKFPDPPHPQQPHIFDTHNNCPLLLSNSPVTLKIKMNPTCI